VNPPGAEVIRQECLPPRPRGMPHLRGTGFAVPLLTVLRRMGLRFSGPASTHGTPVWERGCFILPMPYDLPLAGFRCDRGPVGRVNDGSLVPWRTDGGGEIAEAGPVRLASGCWLVRSIAAKAGGARRAAGAVSVLRVAWSWRWNRVWPIPPEPGWNGAVYVLQGFGCESLWLLWRHWTARPKSSPRSIRRWAFAW
jgi:hypothetical protein